MFTVYPSPARDRITVQLHGTANAALRIWSLTGTLGVGGGVGSRHDGAWCGASCTGDLSGGAFVGAGSGYASVGG